MLAGVGVAAALDGPGHRLASVAAFMTCTAAAITVLVIGTRRVTGPRAGWAGLDRAATGLRHVGWSAWATASASQVVIGTLLLLWSGRFDASSTVLPVLTAVLIGSALAALGVALRSTRLFACASFAGGALVAGDALASPLPLLLAACAVVVVGGARLARFVRRFPLDGARHADRRPVRAGAPLTSEPAPDLIPGEMVSEGAILPCAFEGGADNF
jgi:hypothetical protein